MRHTIIFPPFPPISVCLPTGSLNTDSLGWMNAADFLEAKSGGPSTGFCANPHLQLAVWDSNNAVGFGPPNPDGHYVLSLEWEDGTGFHREAADHHIQLDNKAPAMPIFTTNPADPVPLEVRLQDGTTVVPVCGQAMTGAEIFQVWAQFSDPYYWNFDVSVYGGIPPNSAGFGGAHNYYDLNDGTIGVKNTNATGTTPPGDLRYLLEINMNELGASFVDCCYLLEIRVHDAAILNAFAGLDANEIGVHETSRFVTFAAAPAPGP